MKKKMIELTKDYIEQLKHIIEQKDDAQAQALIHDFAYPTASISSA